MKRNLPVIILFSMSIASCSKEHVETNQQVPKSGNLQGPVFVVQKEYTLTREQPRTSPDSANAYRFGYDSNYKVRMVRSNN